MPAGIDRTLGPWLLVNGRIVVADDAIPGLDMGALRAEAGMAVRTLMRGA